MKLTAVEMCVLTICDKQENNRENKVCDNDNEVDHVVKSLLRMRTVQASRFDVIFT